MTLRSRLTPTAILTALTLVTATTATTLANAEPVTAHRPTPPWLATPTGSDFSQLYPNTAQMSGLGGAAVVRCRIAASGLLVSCFVMEEAPEQQGFGAAALGLARGFRMDPKTQDPRGKTGAVITIPIRFDLDGGVPRPRLNLMLDDVAMLVTFVESTPQIRGQVFGCPSTAKPQRRCQSHPIRWVDSPSIDAEGDALADIDLTSGAGLLECKSSADGSLTGCKLNGDTSPKTEAAALEVARHLRAPERAVDGVLLSSGRLLIEFDWAALQRLKIQPPPVPQ